MLWKNVKISYAQYLQRLYDMDSTSDWGYDIFIKPDSTYLIYGMSLKVGQPWALFNLHVSSDGSTIISKKKILEKK